MNPRACRFAAHDDREAQKTGTDSEVRARRRGWADLKTDAILLHDEINVPAAYSESLGFADREHRQALQRCRDLVEPIHVGSRKKHRLAEAQLRQSGDTARGEGAATNRLSGGGIVQDGAERIPAEYAQSKPVRRGVGVIGPFHEVPEIDQKGSLDLILRAGVRASQRRPKHQEAERGANSS